jgi:hypothetical protein
LRLSCRSLFMISSPFGADAEDGAARGEREYQLG